MDIILKKPVQGLGGRNELIKVRPGYARNYLIPQGLAIMATTSARKDWEETSRQNQHKRERALDQAKELAQVLSTLTLKLTAKASAKGSIYGAITPMQISKAFLAEGHAIGRDQIRLKESIKQVGTHNVEVMLHTEVKQQVGLVVSKEGAEDDPEESQDTEASTPKAESPEA